MYANLVQIRWMFNKYFFFISADTISFINAFLIYFGLTDNRKREKFSRQHSTTTAQEMMEKDQDPFILFFWVSETNYIEWINKT